MWVWGHELETLSHYVQLPWLYLAPTACRTPVLLPPKAALRALAAFCQVSFLYLSYSYRYHGIRRPDSYQKLIDRPLAWRVECMDRWGLDLSLSIMPSP